MKRVVGLLAITLMLGACGSTTNDFEMQNGVCYRIHTEKRLGIQTNKAKLLAAQENCGVPVTGTTYP